jgi:hypothetical protein
MPSRINEVAEVLSIGSTLQERQKPGKERAGVLQVRNVGDHVRGASGR